MKSNNGEVTGICCKFTQDTRAWAHTWISYHLLKTYYLSGSTIEILCILKLFNFILNSNKICNAIVQKLLMTKLGHRDMKKVCQICTGRP